MSPFPNNSNPPDPLHLGERNFPPTPVIETGGVSRGMASHLLGHFE